MKVEGERGEWRGAPGVYTSWPRFGKMVGIVHTNFLSHLHSDKFPGQSGLGLGFKGQAYCNNFCRSSAKVNTTLPPTSVNIGYKVV